MKIALVIENLDVTRGGRETSTAQIAAALAAAGQQVTVLCQSGSPPADLPYKIRPLGKRGLQRTTRFAEFQAAVAQAAKDETFDIVHAMMPLAGANVYQLRSGTVPAQFEASLRRRSALARPLVRLAWKCNKYRQLTGQVERQLAADPRVLLLPVSQMVADELATHYGRRDNVRVVYNAVDLPAADDEQRQHWRQQLRYKLAMKSDDLLMLVVAKNFALKAVAETIQAFAVWQHTLSRGRKAQLVVVGRHPVEVEGYQRHASLREVGRQVHFVEHDKEIFRWYSAADANILLSWYDPCSRVVLEATRWGVPSITTAFNGAAEVLRQHDCGVVVSSPGAQREVVKAIAELTDDARRTAMAAKCLSAGDGLSIQCHVQQLIEAYQAIR